MARSVGRRVGRVAGLAGVENKRVGRVGVGDGAPRERRQNLRRSKRATSHVARHTHVRVCRLCVRAFRRFSTSRLVRGTVGDVARRRSNARRVSASRFLGSRFRLRSRRREQRARPRLNRVCPTRFDVTIGGHDVHTIAGRVRPPFRRRARLSRARGLPRPRRRLRGTRRASREARVEVRGIASRRRRGHVRGRAGERAEEVRAPARVPAGRVPPVEPRAPRRVRSRRDGASRVRRRLGGFECHRSETRVEGRPRGRRLRRGRGGRLASRLRAGIGHPHPARALRGARLSLWRATSVARFEPSEWRAFQQQVVKIGRAPTETALRPPSTVIFFQSFLSLSKEKKRTKKKYISYAHQSDTFAPSIDGGRRVSFFHAF